jgi:hypothetical protein
VNTSVVKHVLRLDVRARPLHVRVLPNCPLWDQGGALCAPRGPGPPAAPLTATRPLTQHYCMILGSLLVLHQRR